MKPQQNEQKCPNGCDSGTFTFRDDDGYHRHCEKCHERWPVTARIERLRSLFATPDVWDGPAEMAGF